ncbi:MAG: GGDEF and EAL domain-containing protein [Actinobacteria bacterium]|nr:GGDEF and EAL domain-containing protein [Actinomycetota bacterium]
MSDDPRTTPGADTALWVVVDSAFVILSLSEAARARLGPAHGQAVGMSLVDFTHPDDLDKGLGAFAAVMTHVGQRPAGTYRVQIGPSRYETFDVTGEQLDSSGSEVLLRLTSVGERRRSEILALGQVEILEMASSGAPLDQCMREIVTLCESFIEATAAVVHVLDAGRPQPIAGSVLAPEISNRLQSLNSWRQYEPFRMAQDRGLPYVEHNIEKAPHWKLASRALHSSRWRSCVTSPIQDSAGRPLGFIEVLRASNDRPENEELTFYLLMARLAGSVVSLRNSEIALHRASREDRLTGLGDARALTDRLRLATQQGSSFSLLVLDLDRFRWVNNNFGHTIGDALLKVVGARFAAATESWGVTYRHAGNAFIVFVPDNVCIESVVEHSVSLLRCLDDPVVIDNTAHNTAASVGVARFIHDRDSDPEEVLAKAEAAMYTAKDSGGNAVRVYSLSSAERTQRRMSLASVFLNGLNDHQFKLVFQPIFAFSDASIVGVETLTRWDHPTLGLVSPDEFVPIAEQSGFFVDLDRWVLNESLRHREGLERSGLCHDKFQSWVNLAPRTLEHPELMRLFDDAGNDVQRFIGLEITERQGFEDLDSAVRNICKLRNRGFDIALDDYGTGRASLIHLAELDISGLKIDRTFVDRLVDPRVRKIVEHMVSLGHSLGLRVTAEGIETEDQYHDAKGMGFDTAQGYFMSRPIPGEQLAKFLRDRAADRQPLRG